MIESQAQILPRAAAAPVLACGAWLKNRALLLDGDRVWWSPVHGDLGTPAAQLALQQSLAALVERADGAIAAVAHDLHPDFASTQAAIAWAQRLGVVQAECGLGDEPLIGLALDGFGLGADGQAWGGEVLCLRGADCARVAHLPPLAQPGGDARAGAAAVARGRGGCFANRLLGSEVGAGLQAAGDRCRTRGRPLSRAAR